MFKDIDYDNVIRTRKFCQCDPTHPLPLRKASVSRCAVLCIAAEGAGDRAASRTKECHTKTPAKGARKHPLLLLRLAVAAIKNNRVGFTHRTAEG